MRILTILCLFLIGYNTISAQKAYKPIKANIKANRDLDKSLQILSDCTKNEKFARDPQLYLLKAAVWQKINDVENEKVYLKQSYDTVKFFTSTLGIFESLIACDSVEQIPDKKGRIRIKSRAKSRLILKRYYPNLASGGKFFLKKSDYKQAYTFFSAYLDVAESPILDSEQYQEKDRSRPRIAYWCVSSGYKQGDYNKVFKYKDLALKDRVYRSAVLELLASSYGHSKDTLSMVSTLQQGIREYPTASYFFTTLFDYYNVHAQYDRALLLADTMITTDKTNVLYKYAKSLSLMNMKAYDACIAESMEILSLDSTHAETYYNLGACYCNRAADMEKAIGTNVSIAQLREFKKQLRLLYRTALPYMEKYRFYKPDASDKWAPVLYRIYLNLNMGKQFDEIEKILRKTASQ